MNKLNMLAMMCLFAAVKTVQAAPVVYLDFNNDAVMDTSVNVTAGDSLTASLYISGIDSSNSGLLSWGSLMQFDSSLLSAASYQIAPQWILPGVNNGIDNGAGSIDLFATAFSGYSGTLKLADIVFDASVDGIAQISLGNINPGNANFDGFVAANGYTYDSEISFNGASVNITAVPVPAAFWLMFSGVLAGAGILRRRT